MKYTIRFGILCPTRWYIFWAINLRFQISVFLPFYEHFRQLREKYAFKLKIKYYHVNQLIEADLMMYIYTTFAQKKPHTPFHSTHSTYLFKIFFSLLTLSTAFLQKASGPGKNIVYCLLAITCSFIKISKYLTTRFIIKA